MDLGLKPRPISETWAPNYYVIILPASLCEVFLFVCLFAWGLSLFSTLFYCLLQSPECAISSVSAQVHPPHSTHLCCFICKLTSSLLSFSVWDLQWTNGWALGSDLHSPWHHPLQEMLWEALLGGCQVARKVIREKKCALISLRVSTQDTVISLNLYV